MKKVVAVVLAAGRSTRMQSKKSKLLFNFKGKSLIEYVRDACRDAGFGRIIMVVGHNANEIKNVLGNTVQYVYQYEPRGTAHALIQAKEQLLSYYKGEVLVLPGDAPFITPWLLQNLIRVHRHTKAAASLLTTVFPAAPPYARIIRDKEGDFVRLAEEYSATPKEKLIREVSTTHFCFDASKIFPLLGSIENHNCKKEYILSDVFELAHNRKLKIATVPFKDCWRLFGINTRTDLAKVRKMLP